MLIKQSKKHCKCSKNFGRDCSVLTDFRKLRNGNLRHVNSLDGYGYLWVCQDNTLSLAMQLLSQLYHGIKSYFLSYSKATISL